MYDQDSIRNLLIEQINSTNAHANFNQAVEGISWQQAGIKVEQVPYTIWELTEHIRISQDDILDFCINEDYKEIDWPDAYWPGSHKPNSENDWEESKSTIREGIERMKELIRNPKLDLQKPLPHGSGQTLFREAMLIIDHGAYHTGQIILIRRLLGNW